MNLTRALVATSAFLTAAATFLLPMDTASAQSTTDMVATGYFVDCDAGDDNAAGTSHTSPWKTLSKVNQSVSTPGADVWLKAGTTCTMQTLTIDWPGVSEGDPVVVGSYYVSGGVAYAGFPGSTRATIQGSYIPLCRVWPSKCAWNTRDSDSSNKTSGTALPASQWDGLVQVVKPYVTVQDLTIRDSAGYGIVFDGFSNGTPFFATAGASNYYWTAKDNLISHVATGGISFQSGRYIVARNNEVEYTDLSWHDHQGTQYNWANGIFVGRCYPCYALIENNYVHDNYGEGIGNYGASVTLVRGNRVANTRSAAIYMSGGRNVVEQNIVSGGTVVPEVGLGDSSREGDFKSAYAFAREPETSAGEDNPEDTTKQLFRNNMGAGNGMCLEAFYSGTPYNLQRYRLGGRVVGNTCVTALSTSPSFRASYDNDVAMADEGVIVSNNLFAVPSGISLCESPNVGNVEFERNFWTGTPANENCKSPGTGDRYATYADVGLVSSFANFVDADKSNFPSYADFSIGLTSGAATGGSPLATVYLSESDWAWVLAQRSWLPACGSAQVPLSQFVELLTTDYCGNPRGTSMGALNAGGSSPATQYVLTVD